MRAPKELRDDLVSLAELATIAGSGLVDRAYQIIEALDLPGRQVADPSELASPGIEAERSLQDVRAAQRTAAGMAQLFRMLRTQLKQNAMVLVLGDADAPGADVRAVTWYQLRGLIDILGDLIERLEAVSLTAHGPGPICAPHEVPRVPSLAELAANGGEPAA